MENAKGKGKACFSKSKPKKNDSINHFEIDIVAYVPVEMNVEEPMVFSKGENTKEEDVNEENIEEEVKNEEKVEAYSKEKVNKSRKRIRKKMRLRNIDIVVSKYEDEPESLGKKATKKVESMGMIFICSSKTKKDCYCYKVLGLPASRRDIVLKIYKGMRLFLFDVDLKLLYGIYKATGPWGYNLEPKAFKSAFPSQVRFTVLDDCLPLAEEKFKKVIKDNYYTKNKFNCQLTSKQVRNLCKLFRPPSEGPKSKQSGRSLRAEGRTFVDRNRIRRWDQEEDRHPASLTVAYERDTFVSPVPRLPLPPPPAPALPPPSYAYGRTLEVDVYGWDPLLEHHDRRLFNLELRHRDEIECHDPYILYREPPLYRDPLYSVGSLPECHCPVDPPLVYHPPGDLPPDYHLSRPLYWY